MVKKNQGWERRVEIAELRRSETKLRRQRTADRRQHKAAAQELLALLDRLAMAAPAQRPLRLHLWTEVAAVDGAPILDAVRGDAEAKGRRRARSESLNESPEPAMESNLLTGLRTHGKPSRKGRARSNSVNDTVGPSRSDEAERAQLCLCRSHFFTGKCQDVKGRKGSCRYIHYCAPYKTLNDVLRAAPPAVDAETMLKLSAEAQPAPTSNGAAPVDGSAMEMVHYTPVEIKSDNDESFISEQITNQLASQDIKPTSIVYAVVNDHLIFDRHQDGVLVGDREFIGILAGAAGANNRRLSVGDETDGTSDERMTELPGSVLEHMLTFLDDSAVAVVSKVCSAWHSEIGHSLNLWHHMLERRHWPAPSFNLTIHDVDAIEATRASLRQSFIEHYTAMRDMKAIQLALYALVSRKVQAEKEMCYLDFSTRKYAPTESNRCIGVQVWSPNRVLVAYAADCSLRLFECTSRGGEEKVCRELICQSVDPYKNTKKRSCCLVSVALDQDFIGCLCQVNAEGIEAEAWILVLTSRDEFLQGQSSAATESSASALDTKPLKVIDIGEAVLNHLLSSDVVDHRLLQLMDFLFDGGQIGEIEVLVSHSIAACGGGRFMVEVSISVPVEPDLDMHLVDRKLVMFSANAGAILWIGESNNISKGLRPRHENMSLHYVRRRMQGASRPFCHLVVGSPVSPDLLLGSIEPGGNVQSAHPMEACDLVREEILSHEWQLIVPSRRPIVVTASYVVAVDVIEKVDDERRTREVKSFISAYPLRSDPDEDLYRKVVLNDLETVSLVNVNDQHVIALCRQHDSTPSEDPGAPDEWAAGGTSLWAVCLHIDTGCEIGRCCLLDDIGPESFEVPLISTIEGSTVGAALSWKGVIMTGEDVRSVGRKVVVIDDNHNPFRSSQKKKKKKTPSKSYRKDGFMRGMSLRG